MTGGGGLVMAAPGTKWVQPSCGNMMKAV